MGILRCSIRCVAENGLWRPWPGVVPEAVCRPETQRVYISHGDCPEEAEQLAQMVRDIAQPKELIVCLHEPLTGAHVGPGMLALFFLSEGR